MIEVGSYVHFAPYGKKWYLCQVLIAELPHTIRVRIVEIYREDTAVTTVFTVGDDFNSHVNYIKELPAITQLALAGKYPV